MDFKNDVWNEHVQISLVNAAKYYIQFVIVKNFYDFIKGANPILKSGKSLKDRSAELQRVFHLMF